MNTILSCIFKGCVLACVLGALSPLSGQGAEFLIITADEFTQSISDLAEWKYMKGIPTTVVQLTDIDPSGSPTKEEIKEYISNAYNTWDPTPHYILFVGDASRIPGWLCEGYSFYSDNPYGDMTGDCKAELAIGRFAVRTVDTCETVVAKTLAYERTPGLEGLDWLHKATLVLREDQGGNGPYYATLDYLYTILTDFGYDPVDYFIALHGGGGDDAEDVIAAIDDGRSFVIYRGTSFNRAWTSPMTVWESDLNNGWKLPIVISGSCYCGRFNYPDAMCNTWTQAGSAQEPRGAVALLGPASVVGSELASWGRHLATRGIMDEIFVEDTTILGDAFVNGKYAMLTEAWAVPPEYKIAEYWAWSLAGDPTLQVWTGVPGSMAVGHIDVVESDVPFDLTVTVHDATGEPIEDALVTLYKAGWITPEVFERDSTDSDGNALFENIVVPTTGVMRVTVTYREYGVNYIPYQGEIKVFQVVTDEEAALAYNSNRHLVRTPNTEELHLIYTRGGEVVYRHSTNGGADWDVLETVGAGEFPAIALASDNLPSVAWTDEEGGLWYRRKISSTNWSDIYHLDDPTSPVDLHLNSPPAIAIHPSNPNTVHILVTRLGATPEHKNIYSHTLEDFAFPINYPGQGWFDIIEEKLGPLEPPLRLFPSIARCEVNNSLHATWQRVDTICYAVKPRNDWWVNWGDAFYPHGHQSAHPFVETYGDSVYVVCQHLDLSTQKEEIYRWAGHIDVVPPYFSWQNLSMSPNLVSLYSVNASGFFTTYAEEPTTSSPYDVYYKVSSYDDRINISNTLHNSCYPQCAARFTFDADFLYTAWLEGDDAPYEVRFRKIQHQTPPDKAYLSSSNGQNTPSPYLVARDSYIEGWQIPVDVGNTATSYEFPLVPGYAYKAKAVVYHEGSGPWSGRVKIDNNLQFNVTYNGNLPETLECWIPPVLYEDSVLTVSFNRISGDFAAIGPIYIYRYEYENGGGPMSQKSQPMRNASIAIFPNPFTERLNIICQITSQHGANLKLYDVMGRLVKQFELSANEACTQIIWDGIDGQGRAVPQGVYFLRVDNPDSGDILCQKVLRVK